MAHSAKRMAENEKYLLACCLGSNTDALNEMLKRVQHDEKKCVIPNLFRNLEFGNDIRLISS